MARMETGTSWIGTSRLVAVTMTSSSIAASESEPFAAHDRNARQSVHSHDENRAGCPDRLSSCLLRLRVMGWRCATWATVFQLSIEV